MSTAAEAVEVAHLHAAGADGLAVAAGAAQPDGARAAHRARVIVLAGLLARFIAPHDPNATDIGNALASPSGDHWLGTDSAGRDVLSRLLYGTQNSLAAAALAVGIALAVGVVGGLIAGYFGGWFDNVANWVVGLTMSLPGVVVLLAASSVLGPSIWTAMAIFGLPARPSVLPPRLRDGARRAQRAVRRRRQGERSQRHPDHRPPHPVGGPRPDHHPDRHRVQHRHRRPGRACSSSGLGDLEVPTWGSLLVDGFDRMFSQQLLLLWPCLVLGITTLSLVLFANGVRDELERVGPRVERAACRSAGDRPTFRWRSRRSTTTITTRRRTRRPHRC